ITAGYERLLLNDLKHVYQLVPQMQERVEEMREDALVLHAPLAPIRNHIGTVFGGSLNALATLACWGLVWLALHGRGAHIVIHEGRMKFARPATAEFSARCRLPAAADLQDLAAQLERRGRARIALTADVECRGQVVASFEGVFAAIRPDKEPA